MRVFRAFLRLVDWWQGVGRPVTDPRPLNGGRAMRALVQDGEPLWPGVDESDLPPAPRGRHEPGQDTVPLHELLARVGARPERPRSAERTQQIPSVDLQSIQLFGDPGTRGAVA